MDRPVSAATDTAGTGPSAPGRKQRGRGASSARVDLSGATGLNVARRFTREGVHPFDEVTWEKRSAVIGNERGETVFEQKDVEMPSTLVADGHQRRGQQVLPRPAGHAAPRDQRHAR